MTDALDDLRRRGLFHQCTDEAGLASRFRAGRVVAYAGFDATSDSLHVGHLLPLMALRRLQAAGHKPIVVVGGGTTKVGDPSFRDDARPFLDDDAISANAAGLKRAFERYLRFGDGPTDAVLVDNADWLDPLGFVSFLRVVGRHFTVGRMLSFEGVKRRLDREQSMSLLEFNYQVLQSFDFLELSRRMDCSLQVGGSDQWGNIVGGIELARKVDGRTLFGLTTPLLATSDGRKMGKTAGGGTAWLNADKLDPYGLWQFWRGVPDADVGRFLATFTDLTDEEVARLASLRGAEANEAKVALADAATAMAHGEGAAAGARRASEAAFSGEAAGGVPNVVLSPGEAEAGVPVYVILVRAGFAKSNAEARRAIAQGAARVDDAKVGSESAKLGTRDLWGGPVILSLGRRRRVAVALGAP